MKNCRDNIFTMRLLLFHYLFYKSLNQKILHFHRDFINIDNMHDLSINHISESLSFRTLTNICIEIYDRFIYNFNI